MDHNPNYSSIFTNDSKDNDKAACTVICKQEIITKKFPKEMTIFSAEVCAIDISHKNKKVKLISFVEVLRKV